MSDFYRFHSIHFPSLPLCPSWTGQDQEVVLLRLLWITPLRRMMTGFSYSFTFGLSSISNKEQGTFWVQPEKAQLETVPTKSSLLRSSHQISHPQPPLSMDGFCNRAATWQVKWRSGCVRPPPFIHSRTGHSIQKLSREERTARECSKAVGLH